MQNKNFSCISVGFVIYYSEKSVLDRINATLKTGYKVYIFDNSPSDSLISNFCKKTENCVYITLEKNVGLGIGISSICKQAFNDGFDALLFFDQDTIYSDLTLDYISNYYLNKKLDFQAFAAIQFCQPCVGDVPRKSEFPIKIVKLLISSGSLYNLSALNKINWHNKTYFVDGVDYEFSLRASVNGYLLGRCCNTPEFDHISGQEDRQYYLFGWKLFLRAYAPSRIRDILRSYSRLFLFSLKQKKYDYTIIFIKSFFVFSFYQILVRIILLINTHEKR